METVYARAPESSSVWASESVEVEILSWRLGTSSGVHDTFT